MAIHAASKPRTKYQLQRKEKLFAVSNTLTKIDLSITNKHLFRDFLKRFSKHYQFFIKSKTKTWFRLELTRASCAEVKNQF